MSTYELLHEAGLYIQHFFWPVPAGFWVGLLVLSIYQVGIFGRLNESDLVLKRYTVNISDISAIDFAGIYTFRLGQFGFILISALLYLSACRLSPEVLSGIMRVFGKEKSVPVSESELSIYLVALYMGLAQPILPRLSKAGIALRDVVHDQMYIPKRLLELIETVSQSIIIKSPNRDNLKDELRRICSPSLRENLKMYFDISILDLRLEKVGVKDSAQVNDLLEDISSRELKKYIECVVAVFLVSAMRHSGGKGALKTAKKLSGEVVVTKLASGQFLPRLFAFSSLNLLNAVCVCVAIVKISPWIASRLSVDPGHVLWPTRLKFAGLELGSIQAPIFVGMTVVLFDWAVVIFPKKTFVHKNNFRLVISFMMSRFYSFFACYFLICVALSVADFYGFGAYRLDDTSYLWVIALLVPFQGIIITSICICTIMYLRFRSIWSFRSLFFACIIGVSAVGALSAVKDTFFLEGAYLIKYPEYRPAYDHLIFAVTINVLVCLLSFFYAIMCFSGSRRVSTNSITLD